MEDLKAYSGFARTEDGIQIAYQVSGEGPPLVCCHAMGADHRMWDDQRKVFSESHTLITFDQRGSGDSDHPKFTEGPESLYTVDTFGDDLRAVLDALEIEKASILGFSMGVIPALSFSTRWPDRVEKLILASAMASRLPEEFITRALQVEDVLHQQGLQQAYEFYFSGPMFKELSGVSLFQQAVAKAQTKATPDGFQGCFRVTIQRPSLLEKLSAIKSPTLILVGEQDTHYLPEADCISEKIKNSKKVIIKNAGHPMTFQNAEAFEQQVLGFLE